jgi:hypothetical protein
MHEDEFVRNWRHVKLRRIGELTQYFCLRGAEPSFEKFEKVWWGRGGTATKLTD